MRDADTPPDAALLAQVADTLAWPLLLLRRNGSLLHANLAARALLHSGQWIALDAQHQLQLLEPVAHRAFVQALASTGRRQQQLMRWRGVRGVVTATLTALAAPMPIDGDNDDVRNGGHGNDGNDANDGNDRRNGRDGADSTNGTNGISGTSGNAGSGAHDRSDGPHPDQPMLLALTLPHGRHADLQAFARLHGLTPAESRVLEHLARGENSTRVARALGLAPTTVRAQTASLRRKTGHADVPALLQTLAALPPLAAPESVVDAAVDAQGQGSS